MSEWSFDAQGQLEADYYLLLSTGMGWSTMALVQWDALTLSDWDTLPLDGAPLQAGSASIAYDAAGNRAVYVDEVTSDVTTYTYDDANRLLTAEDPSGITTYTYDATGNRLTIEEPNSDITTNTWNCENRLVQVEHPDSGTVDYAYNGDGLVVEQTVDGSDTTRYVYDGNNRLQETDDIGVTEVDFTYTPGGYGEVISQRRGSDSSFYHFDAIRNVRQLTDDSQVVTDEYQYDAWGKSLASSGSTANSQRYKGELLAYREDPEAAPSPQYALHHRHYDPQTGTFASQDPAEDDINLYRYVKNNPVNREDPSGLEDTVVPPITMVTPPGNFDETLFYARQLIRVSSEIERLNTILSQTRPEKTYLPRSGVALDNSAEVERWRQSQNEAAIRMKPLLADQANFIERLDQSEIPQFWVRDVNSPAASMYGGTGAKAAVEVALLFEKNPRLQLGGETGEVGSHGIISATGPEMAFGAGAAAALRAILARASARAVMAAAGREAVAEASGIPTIAPKRGLRQTGSGFFSGSAAEAYDAIRASTNDVAAIAQNTRIKAANIQKVKDHVFHQEHLLDRYVDFGVPAEMRRFDSDLGIANAWKRLEAGTHTQSDLQLLRHEAAESHLMRRWGDPSYNRAHTRAQRRYPYQP